MISLEEVNQKFVAKVKKADGILSQMSSAACSESCDSMETPCRAAGDVRTALQAVVSFGKPLGDSAEASSKTRSDLERALRAMSSNPPTFPDHRVGERLSGALTLLIQSFNFFVRNDTFHANQTLEKAIDEIVLCGRSSLPSLHGQAFRLAPELRVEFFAQNESQILSAARTLVKPFVRGAKIAPEEIHQIIFSSSAEATRLTRLFGDFIHSQSERRRSGVPVTSQAETLFDFVECAGGHDAPSRFRY